jgi:putative ABC transport system permease protein
VQALPGVLAVTEVNGLPPFGSYGGEIEIPGKTHSDRWQSLCQLVSEGYPKVLGLKLLRGRFLEETDIAGPRRVAVINQTLWKQYFGNEDPMGRQIVLKAMPMSETTNADVSVEVVGIFGDVKNRGIENAVQPEMLLPYTTTGAMGRGIVVRTSGNPLAFVAPLQREIWAVDRSVAQSQTRPLDEFLSDYVYAQPRFILLVLGVFAAVGLALVAVGVYSVIAYTVSRQTREIGIRMALGASRGSVIRMVLRMGLWLIGGGLLAGIALSWLAIQVLKSELFGVTARDPMTFAGVAVVVLVAGVVACVIPAQRATRVDPVIALRFE